MVTLLTEQLHKQSLEDPPYRRAFSLNMPLAEVGANPTVSWSGYGFPSESSWAMFSSKTHSQDPSSVLPPVDALGGLLSEQEPFFRPPVPCTSVTDMFFPRSPPPPPPPPKRHCRSLSVPEDLSRCRTPWRPSASKIWMPVKRRCQSGGGTAGLGSRAGSLPLHGPSPSLPSSSLHSSSSPTFFSLALSSDSPLPWSVPCDLCDMPRRGCAGYFPTPSSCCSSPVSLGTSGSLPQRRFSLSPVHVQEVPRLPPPRFSPAPALAPGCGAMAPSPSSACSTPSSYRRTPRPMLPRCHSQPCDMRKPRLKRRHDPDNLPSARPGLNFSKMTQIGSGESLICGASRCMVFEPPQGDLCMAFSPAEFLGRSSIIPLSESEEEEEEEVKMTVMDDVKKNIVFERDCTELDLNLIEEN
ncbi:protein FAM53C-like [Aplochiton taeniatus]